MRGKAWTGWRGRLGGEHLYLSADFSALQKTTVRGLALVTVAMRARSLVPLVKARGFGMTPIG
jgi:hypothetical protein